MNDKGRKSFEEAGAEKQTGMVGEFVLMLKENKKYWMIPLIVILLGFGLLLILGGTSVAPFIYTLF